MHNDERPDNIFDEAVTEPHLPGVTPSADDTASLGRTVRANDHWAPPLTGWRAPLDTLDDTEPMLAAPHVADDATGWSPSPELSSRPTRRMRRVSRRGPEGSLIAAMGALTTAALVCAVAAIAIAFVSTHANLVALSSQRQDSARPAVTVQPTATATRTPVAHAPTPTSVTHTVSANPLPITQPTATSTPAAPTPTTAPTTTPTAQPTATAPAPTPTTAPTATATPAATPTATPAPTQAPTVTSGPAATPTTPTTPAPTPTP